MSPRSHTNQIALALGNPFLNRGLFADHFLLDRIGELDQWKAAEGTAEAFAAIDRLYRERASRFRNTTNESQTERDFVRPVLDILWKENEPGDCYEVQVNIPNVDARRQPDYGFFRMANDRISAESRKGTLEYWRDVPVLGDAKAWFASLDRQAGVVENPSAQITNYLYRSGVRWGILTNGRVWRLYENEKSRAGGVFYEIDLEEILKRNDLNAFKYFYLFFRREAFLPGAGGNSFVEQVLQGSVKYATKVGDRLKESVYDALRSLMNGFFEHPGNSLDRGDPETLKFVHDNSLIVLYRLLFLLYAEDGGLLPSQQEPYHSVSLLSKHREINDALRSHRPYLPTSTNLWGYVCNLIRLIDEGYHDDDKVIIPAYNGGLFSPSRFPNIAHTPQPGERRWEIGDRYIAEAVDQLAYERESWDQPGTRDIDYKTLDVRHLGSIYEGLLELQPHVASEPLVEVLEDGKRVYKPEGEVANPRPVDGQPPHTIAVNEVYLTTNRGERKATGSYYTPKHIVDYIVDHTVGPLVDDAARKVTELRPSVDREIRKRERERKKYPADAVHQIEKAERAIEEQKRRLLDPYLSLRILDPAMGSGHFLVGAADVVSMAMATDPNLPAAGDAGDEDAQTYYKRLVVERCLYGVDLNPLAVELAKLSLWLHTVSRDKALSFLDHHLRCGNSLIGARVEQDLMVEPPQFNARGRMVNADRRQRVLGFTEALTGTHLSHFLETISKIVETPGGTAESEHWKETVYRDMDAKRDMYRAVAHCWVAPFFGASTTPQQYQEAVRTLRGTIPEWKALKRQQWFAKAMTVAEGKRFFHWELEFPEVFFDADGFKVGTERGFDAIIGNPPYGDILADDEKRALVGQGFESGGSGNNDVFRFFVERGVDLAEQGRKLSFIIPNPCLNGAKYRNYRRKISGSATVTHILDFKTHKHFDADVFTHIPIFRIETPTITYSYPYVAAGDGFWQNKSPTNAEIQPGSDEPWLPSGDIYSRLSRSDKFLKLVNVSDSRDVGINYQRHGVGWQNRQASGIAARILYEGPQQDDRDVQYLKGEDIGRFVIAAQQNRWLRHNYAELVSEGESVSVNREWARKSPKLLTRQTGDSIIGAVDYSRFYTGRSLHTTVITDTRYAIEFLSSVLNSSLLTYLYRRLAQEEGRAQAQVNLVNVRKLPIPRITFNTSQTERTDALRTFWDLYDRYLSDGRDVRILNLVEDHISRSARDVLHDFLAALGQRMTAIKTEKGSEEKGFLTWLERSFEVPVDNLKNKTRIRSYHENDVADLVSVLRSNQRKMRARVNLSSRNFQETLEREFNMSVQKLQPLKERIEATEKLIDEIVFRMYELTEDEINLIKSQS